MLNQFYLERELLIKIQRIEKLCRACKVEISSKIREKAQNLSIKIPAQLDSKMCDDVSEEDEKMFDCKFCGKEFNDGRKLGGHISRAHPHQKTINEFAVIQKHQPKQQSQSIGSESSEGYSKKRRKNKKESNRFKKLNHRFRFSMVKKEQNNTYNVEDMNEQKPQLQNQVFRQQ